MYNNMCFTVRIYIVLLFFGILSDCYGETQYQRISTRMTWAEADGDCRSRNGNLLILDSQEKVSEFQEQIDLETGEMLWTSGYREHSPWVWIEGCFSSKRMERSNVHTIAANQASLCAMLCQNDTYGALKGTKCFCFDDLRELAPLDARACNIPCAGSGTEMCGGQGAVSVFSIGGVKGYKESFTDDSLTVHEESRTDWKNCVYILKHDNAVWITTDCRKQLPFLCKIYKEEGTIMEYRSPSGKTSSFTEARALCREEGGTLADLHANNIKAVSALPNHNEFWVGLYRNTSWKWHTEDTTENPQWCTVVSKDSVGQIHFVTKSCSLPQSYVCQRTETHPLASDESQMVIYVVCGTIAWVLAILTTVFIIYCKKKRGCRRRTTSEDNTRINANYFDLDEESSVSRQNSHSYVNEASQAPSSSSTSARGLAASQQQEQKDNCNSKLTSTRTSECSRYYTVNGNEYATVMTGKAPLKTDKCSEGACGTTSASSSRSSTSTDPDYDHVWDSLGKLGKKPVGNGVIRHYENSCKATGKEQHVKLPERKENDYETFPARPSLKPSEEIILSNDKHQLERMRSNSL